MVTNARYGEMKELYTKDAERWRNKYLDKAFKCACLAKEVDIYKSLLVKYGVFDETNRHSDNVFVFEGKIYKAVSCRLDVEQHHPAELSVDFVRVEEEI